MTRRADDAPDRGLPLSGLSVLVPRSGPWGERVAALLAVRGATPLISPLVAFEPPEDGAVLDRALAQLGNGDYDWMVATSATVADVLAGRGVVPPSSTRVAAVGRATAAALETAGIGVALVPDGPASGRTLAEAWIAAADGEAPARVLVLRSDLASPAVADAIAAAGNQVDAVIAYRTVTVPPPAHVAALTASGDVGAVLVTSGSVARAIAEFLAPLPDALVLASIGERTTADAEAVGLVPAVTALRPNVEALISALEEHVRALHAREGGGP